MRKSRKAMALAVSVILTMGSLVGCGGSESTENADGGSSSATQEISVVSREDGSGTRGAFVELTGVEEKDADGNKIDNTTMDAIISNSTSIVMTTVSGNENAIGYISLGSLDDTVKGVKVDGVEPTAENIIAGNYQLSRPFNIVTKGSTSETSEVAQDFINYIMSEEGQKVISDNGYIKVDNAGTFSSNGAEGKIVVAGSSSVTPVMEKLVEAYKGVNENATIEIQTTDSTTGISSVSEGTYNIGMASRDLKDSEKSDNIENMVIAKDGIAVVVNKNNTISNVKADDIMKIYTGEVTTWDKVGK